MALEVEGDGVEAGGDEDAVVAGAPEGSDDSVNKDMLAGPRMYSAGFEVFEKQQPCVCLSNKMGVEMLFDVLRIRFFRSRSRCVTIRPTSGDAVQK